MLTQNQQQTIQFLTEQFEKLNGLQQPNKKFNLVDIKPLEDKSERIRQLDEEEKISKKMWTDAQENEIKRIIALFQEDLPQESITVQPNFYGSQLKICRIGFLSNGQPYIRDFHDSCVTINVYLKEKSNWDEYSYKYRTEYTNFYYILNYGKEEYSTIEELVSTNEFKDTLRTRVL
jgi:hypothetical protein